MMSLRGSVRLDPLGRVNHLLFEGLIFVDRVAEPGCPKFTSLYYRTRQYLLVLIAKVFSQVLSSHALGLGFPPLPLILNASKALLLIFKQFNYPYRFLTTIKRPSKNMALQDCKRHSSHLIGRVGGDWALTACSCHPSTAHPPAASQHQQAGVLSGSRVCRCAQAAQSAPLLLPPTPR